MTVHTVSSLQKTRRRVDRRIAKAAIVLQAMQNGVSLNLQFTPNRRWTLSDGRQVDNETAQFVTGSSSVTPVSDTLFRETMSQTWKWWSNE